VADFVELELKAISSMSELMRKATPSPEVVNLAIFWLLVGCYDVRRRLHAAISVDLLDVDHPSCSRD